MDFKTLNQIKTKSKSYEYITSNQILTLLLFLDFLFVCRSFRSKVWRPEMSGRPPRLSPLHPALLTAPPDISAGKGLNQD